MSGHETAVWVQFDCPFADQGAGTGRVRHAAVAVVNTCDDPANQRVAYQNAATRGIGIASASQRLEIHLQAVQQVLCI